MTDEYFISKMNQLPELEREVLRLRIGSKLWWNYISKRLNMQEDSCRVIYSRALKRLRDALMEYA